MRRVDMKEWRAWRGMRSRCTWRKSRQYHRYGGRGIKVCDRWQVFDNFLADMGHAPKGMSLDRINNDGDYEPGNCRWTTPLVQSNNSSFCKRITFNGKTLSISAWAREIGISTPGMERRFREHPVEVALTKKQVTLCGEAVGNSKLTENDIKAMRQAREAGHTYRELAGIFGVSESLAGAIIRRERWEHVA